MKRGQVKVKAYKAKYPKLGHLACLIIGFIVALIYTLVNRDGYGIGITIGLFFAIWLISYLVVLALTWGPLRKKDKFKKELPKI